MCFAAAELGGEVENGARLRALAGETPDDLARQRGQVLREVGPREEPVRLLVIRRGAVVAYVVQVDGKLGGVEGLAFAEVFPGRYDFLPGFEGHKAKFLRIKADLKQCLPHITIT